METCEKGKPEKENVKDLGTCPPSLSSLFDSREYYSISMYVRKNYINEYSLPLEDSSASKNDKECLATPLLFLLHTNMP